MSTLHAENYVSIIGTNYLYPITTLLEKLETLPTSGPNEVQASAPENGYSVAVILLTVILVESAVCRTKYIREESKPKDVLPYLRAKFPDLSIINELKELYVVRDAVVHNHVWGAEFTWDEHTGMKLVAAEKKEGWGDKKRDAVTDYSQRKTRLLGLNVFPTRICREDARLVLRKAVEFLLFLESQDRRYLNVSDQHVLFRGELVPFVELAAGLGED